MSDNFVDLDVREILRRGGEPFEKIMDVVSSLGSDQGLRLYATFKPTPLLSVLGSKGFDSESRELDNGDWEVLFRRKGQTKENVSVPSGSESELTCSDSSSWPLPARHMDNRDLDPPEPMVRILSELEKMEPGDVLSALLCRKPMFLFPQLSKRGHAWSGGFEADGSTYRILIRVSAQEEGEAR